MPSQIAKRLRLMLAVAASMVLGTVPAFAAPVNPATGDGSGMVLPIVGGLLAVSVVLIIVYVVLSAKKKK